MCRKLGSPILLSFHTIPLSHSSFRPRAKICQYLWGTNCSCWDFSMSFELLPLAWIWSQHLLANVTPNRLHNTASIIQNHTRDVPIYFGLQNTYWATTESYFGAPKSCLKASERQESACTRSRRT